MLALKLSHGNSALLWSWARSLVIKGEVSGNVHSLAKAYADCDSDLLLFGVVVFCEGCSCHTLRRSCVYNRLW
ncbi:Phosphoribosyl-AMP cyclohydrolase [Candidatus Hodgkinia cicadicola]|nr:Phosphoribosyl-AMP cyclohydrolase [Candidatus Hodgkinia cicadicola]